MTDYRNSHRLESGGGRGEIPRAKFAVNGIKRKRSTSSKGARRRRSKCEGGGPAGTPESARGSGRPHLQVAVKPVRVPVGSFLQTFFSLRRRGTIAPIEAVFIHEDFGVRFLFLQPHDRSPGQPGSGGAIPGLWPGTPSPPPPLGAPSFALGSCTRVLLGRRGQAQTTPRASPTSDALSARVLLPTLPQTGAAEPDGSGRRTRLVAAHAHKGRV